MTGFTRRRWPVVGRDDEVESALALLGGGSRGLLIHGEGGVGKTTLATALIEEITAGGRAPQVIRLHTDAAVLSTPWKVFADVLDPVSQDSASLTRAVNQVRDRLGQARIGAGGDHAGQHDRPLHHQERGHAARQRQPPGPEPAHQ